MSNLRESGYWLLVRSRGNDRSDRLVPRLQPGNQPAVEDLLLIVPGEAIRSDAAIAVHASSPLKKQPSFCMPCRPSIPQGERSFCRFVVLQNLVRNGCSLWINLPCPWQSLLRSGRTEVLGSFTPPISVVCKKDRCLLVNVPRQTWAHFAQHEGILLTFFQKSCTR